MDANVEALQSYLSSLAPSNPSWHQLQNKSQPSSTFTDRLQREYTSKRPAVERSDNDVDSLARGPFKAAVRIERTSTEGRFLVASQDIRAGEVVFREAPLVVSPNLEAGPTCLACLCILKEAWRGCGGCGAPRCTPPCDGIYHTNKECNIVKRLGLQQDPNSRFMSKQLNVLLSPLRTLLLLQELPGVGAVIAALQSNVENRRKLPVGRLVEEQVIRPMQRDMGLPVNSEVMQQLCGIFDTNCFVISLARGRGGRALFPLGALMNHSCLPNTQHWYKDGVLIVRSVAAIPEGAPITNTYAPTLWGTHARAAYIQSSKFFTCTCERCVDPTELGSHLSSVSCRKCEGGLLVPAPDPQVAWVCNACGAAVDSPALNSLLQAAGIAASRVPQEDATALDATVTHLTRVLGGQHYITIELKFALVLALMTPKLSGVSVDDLLRVVALTQELLGLAAQVDPGLSKFRGVILLELIRASTELLERGSTLATSNDGSSGVAMETFPRTDDRKIATILATVTNTHPTTTAACQHKVQFLLKLTEECEDILQYDCRLPEVLVLKQHLQCFL
nr:SET domain-containing protein SmydA-8-like [Procambarus clarkii]